MHVIMPTPAETEGTGLVMVGFVAVFCGCIASETHPGNRFSSLLWSFFKEINFGQFLRRTNLFKSRRDSKIYFY
jgi:hypothetical protein